MDKNNCLAILLPTGSGNESIRGISHLYEHLILAQMMNRAPGLLWGHTTEDYIILFFEHLSAPEIVSFLRGVEFSPEEITKQYEVLHRELEREKENRDEVFFRFLWQGTGYERSPLGDIRDIKGTGQEELMALRDQLSSKDWFYYTRRDGVKTIKQGNTRAPAQTRKPEWRRNANFNGKGYDIYYFSHGIEEMVLLQRMLKCFNPKCHIHLSEKRKRSALVLEQTVKFPGATVMPSLKEEALRLIFNDIKEIRDDFEGSAVNRLESVYYYGCNWADRINRLKQLTVPGLCSMMDCLNKKVPH